MVNVSTPTPRLVSQRSLQPFLKSALKLLLALVIGLATSSTASAQHARVSKDIAERLRNGDGSTTRVIITGSRASVEAVAARHGLQVRKWLQNGASIDVPPGFLARVADDADVDKLSGDLPVQAHMAVTNVAIGSDQVHKDGWASGMKALAGNGVGVALIDSGVATMPQLSKRIAARLDFTDGHGNGNDDNGHGTHLAGIIAGGALQAKGETLGVAPQATLVSLRVLDARGRGYVSDVIEAIDWAIANRVQFNIQVINLSLGAPVLQSWREDPLDQAVERAYRAGIVVVTAAGNLGKDANGQALRGGITAPGNSPYAITVGALNTKGTPWRSDDEVAGYSSRGPTAIDGLIKPDLVAPGNKIQSLMAPNSTIAREHPELVIGTGADARLQLSGTSMAAAVVTGAVAVLKERGFNARQIRPILQLTSERNRSGLVTSGAGAINLLAAVKANGKPTLIAGESVSPGGIAVTLVSELAQAKTIVWGANDTVVWGEGDTVVWGESDTVVWGEGDTVVWGEGDTVVWGEGDTVVWGESDTVVWGEADTVVWGESDTVVWGESDTVVWGEGDTVVWGEGDTVVWGEADTVVWGE
jgi:serine protease AprX